MTRERPGSRLPGRLQGRYHDDEHIVPNGEPWPTLISLAEALAAAEVARVCGHLPDDESVAWAIARGADRVARLLRQAVA